MCSKFQSGSRRTEQRRLICGAEKYRTNSQLKNASPKSDCPRIQVRIESEQSLEAEAASHQDDDVNGNNPFAEAENQTMLNVNL